MKPDDSFYDASEPRTAASNDYETTGTDPIVGNVEITLTTVAYRGRYSPRHVGAIWIEDGEGKYLRSLDVWAQRREEHLAQWLAASGGKRGDAISGATKNPHQTHTLEWDRMDVDGVEYGAGTYVLRAEQTEDHSSASDPGPQLNLQFQMGQGKMEFSQADTNYYSGVVVQTPG